MTDRQLRAPRTATDVYLAAILDTLGEIRDRLPVQEPQERPGGSVELREPAASPPAGGGEDPPRAPSGGGKGPGVASERPARPLTKTTRRRATKPKET